MADDAASLERALESVLAELREVEPEYRRLRLRVENLRKAEASLAALVGRPSTTRIGRDSSGDIRRGTLQGGGTAQATAQRRLREQAVRRPDMLLMSSFDVNPAAIISAESLEIDGGGGLDQASAASSTDRVIDLLRERGTPMHRDAIRQQFEKRGWIEPSWSQPDAAVRAAIRRAAERPEIDQPRKGWYQYLGIDGGSAAAGGGDASRLAE